MEGKEGCALMEGLNTMMANLNLSFLSFIPPVNRLAQHRRRRQTRGKQTKQLGWTFNKLFLLPKNNKKSLVVLEYIQEQANIVFFRFAFAP